MGKRGPVPFEVWVERVAWALRHIDEPFSLSESPLAELQAVKALGESTYPNSLMPEAYALQQMLQASVDWAVAELGDGGKSSRLAQFLSLYMENPNMTDVAKGMNFSREHVSRYYRPLAFEVVTKAFLKVVQNGTPKYLEEITPKVFASSEKRS